MKMSDGVSEIAGALSAAQGMIDDASKGTKNSFFNSKYADLAAVRAVIREPLAKNGLAIIQFPRLAGPVVEVETMLLHKSGEFFAETLQMPVGKNDPHGIGSAITYARRYGIMSILCIASEDDDGNAAVKSVQAEAEKVKAEEVSEELFTEGLAEANLGMEALSSWFRDIGETGRAKLSSKHKARLKKAATDADAKFSPKDDDEG